ncbi:MAG TPA: biotin carboxylase N-terminal domain-containing protein [Fimbriimonadaceae bacterium]|jgi:3-methylcrotonyl-CoA carboxylase alpha subunit
MKKLLIANRGEIAVRIIYAARAMGIKTVAVYSDADKNSLHTGLADEAVCLGASEPSQSYLDIEKVLDAAKSTGAEAVHPGYGFLSERAEFAEACEKAGLKFVGPSAKAMRMLGSKIEAKEIAVKADVPITPGFFKQGAGLEEITKAAKTIGYPVMLKASAGGGGRGMRVVREPHDLASEFNIASDEALKAFGDGAMMVEKLIDRPRHIEVQVLADQHGTVTCLFERECSLQRRNQKVLEEAPSVVGAQIWPDLKACVERLIKAANYTNAGTVEFMFDDKTGKFYFLEVNARLQVEHPVTEGITGLDLVQWQLRIADGGKLDLSDSLLEGSREVIHGHSIEVRIVAEDPAHGFRPSIGKILTWAQPQQPGVRVDTGFSAGAEVSRYYDSLLAKLIVHGQTRRDAIDKMEKAMLDFHVLGIKTNIPYLLEIVRHPEFRAGRIDTGFLGREFADWTSSREVPLELANILPLGERVGGGIAATEREYDSAWAVDDGFRNA